MPADTQGILSYAVNRHEAVACFEILKSKVQALRSRLFDAKDCFPVDRVSDLWNRLECECVVADHCAALLEKSHQVGPLKVVEFLMDELLVNAGEYAAILKAGATLLLFQEHDRQGGRGLWQQYIADIERCKEELCKLRKHVLSWCTRPTAVLEYDIKDSKKIHQQSDTVISAINAEIAAIVQQCGGLCPANTLGDGMVIGFFGEQYRKKAFEAARAIHAKAVTIGRDRHIDLKVKCAIADGEVAWYRGPVEFNSANIATSILLKQRLVGETVCTVSFHNGLPCENGVETIVPHCHRQVQVEEGKVLEYVVLEPK